jgi:hypothetical protein
MRSQLWLGVLCGLMILGGQLQLFANFIILAVIYALFSGRGTYVGSRLRRLRGLIWPLVIGLLVGMVQLLPTIELMLNSTRAPIGDFNLVTDLKAIASEPGLRLSVLGNFLEKILTLAFPFGWGRLFPTNAQPFPEAVIYVGVTALLCFLAPGRHRRGPFDRFLRKLCVAAILVNIFSLVLNSVFSFIGALEFLNPGRCAMSMAVLALPLLAAWRLDAFRKGDVRLDEAISRRGARAVLSLLLLVTIGATAVMIIITLQLGRALLNPVTAVLFYSGELVVVALLLRHLARAGTITGRDATIEVASAAMIAEGLLLAAVLIFPGARLTTDAVKDNSLTMLFSHEGRPFRVARYVRREEDDFRNLNRLVKQRSPILKPNEAMIIGVDDFQGYNSLNPRVAGEYIKGIDERLFLNLRGSIDLYSPEQLGAPQLDDANVVFILSEVEIDYPNLVQDLDQPVKVYRRITARPRVFRRTDDGGTVPADVIEYRPGYLRVECSTTERSDLILSENFLPGWKAFMDGERAEISTYKSSPFMSVAVPPGEHEVVLAYQPASFVIGFILSLLGLAVVLLLWLLFSRRASSSRRTVSSPSVDTS